MHSVVSYRMYDGHKHKDHVEVAKHMQVMHGHMYMGNTIYLEYREILDMTTLEANDARTNV